jgi:hypothetical protein
VKFYLDPFVKIKNIDEDDEEAYSELPKLSFEDNHFDIIVSDRYLNRVSK